MFDPGGKGKTLAQHLNFQFRQRRRGEIKQSKKAKRTKRRGGKQRRGKSGRPRGGAGKTNMKNQKRKEADRKRNSFPKRGSTKFAGGQKNARSITSKAEKGKIARHIRGYKKQVICSGLYNGPGVGRDGTGHQGVPGVG